MTSHLRSQEPLCPIQLQSRPDRGLPLRWHRVPQRLPDGPPVDPHHPARLSVSDALLDQPDEALLLIRCPTAGTTTPTLFQGLLNRNLHSRSELRRSLESAPSQWGQIRLTGSDTGGYRRCRSNCNRWAVADPSRRFNDLFNLVHDPATLLIAFERVAGNAGARTPGVDGLRVADVEKVIGISGFLDDLRGRLKGGTFRAVPVRERKIHKMRRAHDAIAKIHMIGTKGYRWVLDVNIETCFDTIDHTALRNGCAGGSNTNVSCRWSRRSSRRRFLPNRAIARKRPPARLNSSGSLPPASEHGLSVLDEHLHGRHHRHVGEAS